jgi:hypothetical protein
MIKVGVRQLTYAGRLGSFEEIGGKALNRKLTVPDCRTEIQFTGPKSPTRR